MKGSIFHVAAAASAALAFTAWTSSAHADETTSEQTRPLPVTAVPPGQPVVVTSPRDVVVSRDTTPNFGLITTGVLMLGIPYGVSVVSGATSDRSSDSRLYIPVVGPWMDLAARSKEVLPSGSSDTGNRVLLVADGIFQGLGVLGIIGGFVFPTTKVVTKTATVQVMPTVGSSLVGFGAVGRF